MTILQMFDAAPPAVLRRLFPFFTLFLSFYACAAGLPHDRKPVSGSASLVRPLTTEGGLRGTVFRVTTLEADGPGSLRRALDAAESRLVVFEVGGVIDLKGNTLVVGNPQLTIAGQTAPDPGITLIRGGLVVETHDVVIQHLAVRPGDEAPPGDAIGVRRGHHILVEHCSATWAVDENLSISGPADVEGVDATSHDVTLRHCLIAEGLSHATHPKGEHSKGTLVHDGVRDVTIVGCLYAHNRERNPRLKGGTTAVVSGNVMYNWGSACIGVGARGNDRMLSPAEAVVTGNVAIAGPDTRGKFFVKSVDPGGRVALRDNIVIGVSLADDGVVQLPTPSASIAPLDAAARALRSAGARPARRDPIDARIVRSVLDGTGRIIDSQKDVGGYPVRASATRALVVPSNVDDRRRWLNELSDALSEDAALDVKPLWTRLSIPSK